MEVRGGRKARSLTPKVCLDLLLADIVLKAYVTATRTSTSFGQLSQTKDCIVTRNWLECYIAVPSLFGTLLLIEVEKTILVQLLCLFRANDTNLIILASETAARVADGMNMQFASWRLAGQFTQTLSKFFLEVIVEIILFTEEYHSALRD